jgi:hypothetical protein
VLIPGVPRRARYTWTVTESVQPCGARFFDKTKQDLGRASRITARPPRNGSTLTTLDVVGAEPALARALSVLDRGVLRIHCEDEARTCYVFRWASGYGNGPDLRIQGILEPRTGRELEGWTAKAVQEPKERPPSAPTPSWLAGRPRRPW